MQSLHPETGEPMSVWMVTAAVTCTPNNPSARVFYLDPDTFETVDYETYYLDIATAMGNINHLFYN